MLKKQKNILKKGKHKSKKSKKQNWLKWGVMLGLVGGGIALIVKSTQATEPKLPEKSKTYTVVSGDTLSKIANTMYGDSGKWTIIYEANKLLIGSNPDLILPGQLLIIPILTPETV